MPSYAKSPTAPEYTLRFGHNAVIACVFVLAIVAVVLAIIAVGYTVSTHSLVQGFLPNVTESLQISVLMEKRNIRHAQALQRLGIGNLHA